MFITAVIASILLAVVCAASGLPKAIGAASAIAEARHLGIPRNGYIAIGLLELAAAGGLIGGLLIAPLGIAAATGMLLMMTGATISHLRVRDPLPATLPAMLTGAASAVTLILRLATI